jgi:hypothetical protein
MIAAPEASRKIMPVRPPGAVASRRHAAASTRSCTPGSSTSRTAATTSLTITTSPTRRPAGTTAPLTLCPVERSDPGVEQNQNSPMDHRSSRDQLAFSIGFAVTRSRDLLRRILKEHTADDARQMLANRVIEHLELLGFEIDEADQVMRKRPPTRWHG